jgi:hypothetical protein
MLSSQFPKFTETTTSPTIRGPGAASCLLRAIQHECHDVPGNDDELDQRGTCTPAITRRGLFLNAWTVAPMERVDYKRRSVKKQSGTTVNETH